jgi:putative membrane protein
MHPHGGGSLDALLVAIAAGSIAAYTAGVLVSRRRGRAWPWYRVVAWITGVALATGSVVGPLAAAAHESFVAHAWSHHLGGMLAPLLLVLATPATLALRTLDVTPARRLSRLLRSAPARLVAHPVTATILSAGGLWVIYLSPIWGSMRTNPLVPLVVHAHLLVAGYLFASAMLGLDPTPHPPSRILVAVLLTIAIASHGILTKYLFAHPPEWVAAEDAQAGAQLMYYAGAWIEAIIIVIFCARWYRAAGRRHRSGTVPAPYSAPRMP